MTRVLFHSLTIPPDNVSTGKLVADIANKFSENGQHIEILASTPQYNFDENVINSAPGCLKVPTAGTGVRSRETVLAASLTATACLDHIRDC